MSYGVATPIGAANRIPADTPPAASRIPDGEVIARATGGVKNRSLNERRATVKA